MKAKPTIASVEMECGCPMVACLSDGSKRLLAAADLREITKRSRDSIPH